MATTNEATAEKNPGDSEVQDKNKQSKRREDADVPQGFTTRVGRERGDGWLVKSTGQVIQGRLLGRYTMRGQQNDDGTTRTFYQIRLSGGHEVKAQYTNPDDKDEKIETTLTDGQVLNVDEHKALEELAPYAQDGGVYDVWWKYLSEDPIKGGGKKKRTFWRVQGPRLRIIQAPVARPPMPVDGVRRGTDDEDIPF